MDELCMYRDKRLANQIIFVMLTAALLLFSNLAKCQSVSIKLDAPIKMGESYLKKKILSGQLYLNCKSNDDQVACPVSQSGRVIPAYYVVSMFSLDQGVTQKMSDTIQKVIAEEKKQRLWGYSKNSPPDLDDTSTALQTLKLLGIHQDIGIISAFYHNKMNAYSTFLDQTDTKVAVTPSMQNNFGIHPEINATAYNLLHLYHENKRINFELLSSFQTGEGYWPGYFYSGKYYSTYLHMKLYCSVHPGFSQVRLGLSFIKNAQNKNGSWGHPGNSYDTALALNTLLDCGQLDGVEKGIRYLLSHQGSQGEWSSDSTIWSFVFNEQPLIVWKAYDDQHVLTTALVLLALKKYILHMAEVKNRA